MARQQLGVRLRWPDTDRPGDRSGLLIEQLRYAGVISREENEGFTLVDVWCPKTIGNPPVWQQQNHDRMRSFGLDVQKIARPA